MYTVLLLTILTSFFSLSSDVSASVTSCLTLEVKSACSGVKDGATGRDKEEVERKWRGSDSAVDVHGFLLSLLPQAGCY